MKKLLIACLAVMAFVMPALAQVDHDYNPNDVVPNEDYSLTINQIPAPIVKALNSDFAMSDPLSWTKFPYTLQEYGWVYDKATANLKPDRYVVEMKTTNGNKFYALYSSDGNLIETREISTNISIPTSVRESLANSQYKGWNIIANKEIIRYYHDRNNVEQHFRLTVEKDNVVRSISFNYQGTTN